MTGHILTCPVELSPCQPRTPSATLRLQQGHGRAQGPVGEGWVLDSDVSMWRKAPGGSSAGVGEARKRVSLPLTPSRIPHLSIWILGRVPVPWGISRAPGY